MTLTTRSNLSSLFPFPAIRGTRITRFEQADLGPFRLDADTADRLGRDNIGVFVQDCRGLRWIMERIAVLAETDFPAKWAVVLSSKSMAEFVYNSRVHQPEGRRRRKRVPELWQQGNVVFTTPEGLRLWQREVAGPARVAGILMVDTLCHVHKARDAYFEGYGVHDRPQRVADFRADMAADGNPPPLFVLTKRLAKSVNTRPMLSAYCLDAWWFVDGHRLRFGKPPVSRLSDNQL
jgi:hypothetical protein